MRAVRNEDSRLRVLTLTLDSGSGYGGAEKLVHEFARRIDPARFQSFLCTIHRPAADRHEARASDAAELDAAGVRVLELNQPGFSMVSPAAWWRLYSLLVRESIDIVHTHLARASVPGAILARLARVPVVVCHEHGAWPEGKIVRRFLDRNVVARMSTVMLAVSEWDRNQLIEVEGVPPDSVRVFHNGIASTPERASDLRAELGIPPETPLIGSVGRLAEEKGYDYLIRAVALLKRWRPSVRCIIAGAGPEEQRLRDLAAVLDVGDQVRLLGRRYDVPGIIRALDVAVLSSRWEGSPLVVMEYMAGASPIVATAVGGVPEMVEDGLHGLLVKPRDPQALASGIERLLTDRALAERLGRAAQERQRREYDLDTAVRRLERLYIELFRKSSRQWVRTLE